ncbi:hypothetical protein ASPWEDRAFT_168625 [Aspergillus wentii DTO 134E9]|uniref:Uncharacterized protein n=1 Tax=Aspergillus wentii DTO 134E9 TaxID=1073089 RepID=A0A1L9RV47_ASPWE|nr:uncharacterized protein ASPWEDRAFT_168625 [Aspergillus wentii DTO 134E9]KAI9928652.1 hypothetical protein MW887_001868 [Aspergillus wentii]OJJ38737.1 hypothetical protein ASPWEDRAFT_168625 [Aspergillus wentii DTO 134E9]
MRLPAEIIILIVNFLIPPNPPLVFPPNHEVTKTLLSFTRVSKLTYETARDLLVKHCLYLDSKRSAWKLLSQGPPLRPFVPDKRTTNLKQIRFTPLGLYLSLPWKDASSFDSGEKQTDSDESAESGEHWITPKSALVEPLISGLSFRLRRLVVDILPEGIDDSFWEELHGLYKSHVNMFPLQEYCSIQTSFPWNYSGMHVEPKLWFWSFRENLRHLALTNTNVSGINFLVNLSGLSHLTHLVFTRPHNLLDPCPSFPGGRNSLPRLQRVLIVDTPRGHQRYALHSGQHSEPNFVDRLLEIQDFPSAASGHGNLNTRSSFSILSVAVPSKDDGHFPNDDCQAWVRRHVLDGTLWDFPDPTGPSRLVLKDMVVYNDLA